MTVLHRTDLTTSQKIECAAAAVARQHEHGAKTALSERYEISRPTVYAVGATAESVLRTHFEAPLLGGAGVDVRVDDAQLRRAVVALRVVAPNAIRPIEDLLPVLYPGVKVSYGTIQAMLVEAEGRAARFNAQGSLDAVQAGALDEMFSQGEPVLAGVDLDTGYLFGLSLSPTRDAGAWAGVLREGQGQGLALEVVVKDAARGIAVSARTLFDGAVITVFDERRSPTGTMGAGCRMSVTESSRYAAPALRFGPSGDPPPTTRRSAAMAVSELTATGRSPDALCAGMRCAWSRHWSARCEPPVPVPVPSNS